MARTPHSAVAAIPNSTPVSVFTVPTSEKYVVTHIRIQESAGATATFVVRGLTGTWGAGIPFWDGTLSAAPTNGSYLDYYGQTTFLAGESLQVFTSSGAVECVADYQRYTSE